MKILHVIDSGGLYGAEVMLLHLMQAQLDLGLEPILASIGVPGENDKPVESEARRQGLRVETFRMSPGPNWPGAFKILRFARLEGIELLHSHGYKGNILFGLLPKKLRRFPLVVTVHGWTWTGRWNRMRVYEWLDGLSLQRADSVVLVNQAMKIHPRVAKLCSFKLTSIANGIPLSTSISETARLRPDITRFAGEGFAIIAVGRLSPEKGFGRLIDALAELVHEGHNLRLAIFGQGGLRQELERQSRERRIADRVLFAGYVDNARDYLGCFDLFCLPSFTEGMPMVLLEAMSAGIPIVASHVGGIPEVLDHGRSGILVEPDNIESLKDALLTVLRQPVTISKMVSEAERRVEDLYSSRVMAMNYLRVYQCIVGGNGKASVNADSRPIS